MANNVVLRLDNELENADHFFQHLLAYNERILFVANRNVCSLIFHRWVHGQPANGLIRDQEALKKKLCLTIGLLLNL